MLGILTGKDAEVAKWTWQAFRIKPMPFQNAFALIRDGQPVGSIIFDKYNGFDVEVSHYGDGTLTAGVVKYIGKHALEVLKVERITFHVPRDKKSNIRFLLRLGAVREGNCRRFYGRTEKSEHTAVRLAIFKETIERGLYRGRVH